MKGDDPNPYVSMHREDAIRAWRLAENQDKAEAVTGVKEPPK
jgi:hypothetical protein